MLKKTSKNNTSKIDEKKRKPNKQLVSLQESFQQNKVDSDLKIADIQENIHELQVVCFLFWR